MHFDNSDLYYEHVARSAVNAPFHFVASKAIAAALAVQQGPLRVVVPDAVRCMDGPAVVAATHRSWLDIPLFVQATERAGLHHARPMAKGQWFRNRFIGWVFHEWGAVALDRNKPNLNGINLAFGAFLDAGNSVLAFTEGTRVQTDTGTVLRPKRTALVLAGQHRVPIVPLAIAGISVGDKRRPAGLGLPVVAVFGEPIVLPSVAAGETPSPRELLKQARLFAAELHRAQQVCMDTAYDMRLHQR